MMFLTPVLNQTIKEPIYMQLRDYIVGEIAENRLVAGEKLPSVRNLAKHLGLSKNSIENTYNQLVAEGFIISMERSGYYVAEIEALDYPAKTISNETLNDEGTMLGRYDFKSEYVSEDNFDFKLWKKHLNYIMNYEPDKLYGYGNLRGDERLRMAIAKYYHRARGVVASPRKIVIGGGVSPLLTMLSKLFDILGIEALGMENPGFNKARGIFEYSRVNVLPIPVTKNGISVERLRQTNARLCYVSPSHQFPTGYVMPIGNRQKLLKWANQVDGYILEDDYNSELRFEGKPIPAMQAMDKDERVIYLGSFSTVLAPAIRVSFMVLPDTLNRLLSDYEDMFSQSASILEQMALAHLIDSGDFEKHIRRIRKNYAKKQGAMLRLMDTYLPKEVTPMYGKSGLMILIRLPKGVMEGDVVEICRKRGIIISGLTDYLINDIKGLGQQLVLSYRGIDPLLMEEGIKKLGNVLRELSGYVSSGEGI